MDVVLSVEVKKAAGGDHGGEVLGREPFEPVRGLADDGGRADVGGTEVGEVEVGIWAVEAAGGLVVGHGSLLGGGEGAEPEPGALLGLPDLGHPLAPRPLPHSPVLAGGVLGASLASGGALLPWPQRGESSGVVHRGLWREKRRAV